jgi:hypothetical protein
MRTCRDTGEEPEKSKVRDTKYTKSNVMRKRSGREEFGESWYCIFQNFAWPQR